MNPPGPGQLHQHHTWSDCADASPGYWHTPDHSQGMQPSCLTHKPLCALSTSSWWLAPSHTYYMGISHHDVLPCEPSSGSGSWKASGTPDSLSYLWWQQGFGMGPLWLAWPGHLQASPPHKEELTPAAWPISRLSSSPLPHHQHGKAPVAQELGLVHQICIWLPQVQQADPQPCLHSTNQQPHHFRCPSDVPPSTLTPSELNTPTPTSIT